MAGKQNILLHLDAIDSCNQNDWLKAIAIFQQIETPSAAIHYNIGMCFLQLKQFQNAEEAFVACVNQDKYLAIGYFQLAVTQTYMENHPKAINNFLSCLEAMRGNAFIHYKQLNLACKICASEVRFNLALLYLFCGDLNNAMNQLKQAAEIESNNNHFVHTALHNVIDENWNYFGQTSSEKMVTTSSALFHPSKALLDGIKSDANFRKSAKLVSATNEDYSFVEFVGPVKLQRERENLANAPPLPSTLPPRNSTETSPLFQSTTPRNSTGTPRNSTGTPRHSTGTPRHSTGSPRNSTGASPLPYSSNRNFSVTSAPLPLPPRNSSGTPPILFSGSPRASSDTPPLPSTAPPRRSISNPNQSQLSMPSSNKLSASKFSSVANIPSPPSSSPPVLKKIQSPLPKSSSSSGAFASPVSGKAVAEKLQFLHKMSSANASKSPARSGSPQPKTRPPPPSKNNLKSNFQCDLISSLSIPKSRVKNYDDFATVVHNKLIQMAESIKSGSNTLSLNKNGKDGVNDSSWRDVLLKGMRETQLQLYVKEVKFRSRFNGSNLPALSPKRPILSSSHSNDTDDDIYVDANPKFDDNIYVDAHPKFDEDNDENIYVSPQ